MYQILIVEDDQNLNNGIAMALETPSTAFFTAYNLAQAKVHWQRQSIDMVLLDINLPDGNGYDFLKEIRNTAQIPVLMITANDMEIDEVTGLSLGADDYITKPFSLMVLRARVQRIRKRTSEMIDRGSYQDKHYEFDFEHMHFFVDNVEITLSKAEQKLLKLFINNQGQTLTRDQLSQTLWPDGVQYVDENALSVTVGRLRRKLQSHQKACPIQTVYGLGYVWEKSL